MRKAPEVFSHSRRFFLTEPSKSDFVLFEAGPYLLDFFDPPFFEALFLAPPFFALLFLEALFLELVFFVLDFFALFFDAALPALLARVLAAFFADADLAAADREAEAFPPFFPPFFAGALLVFLPRPDPLFFPPPLILFTVAQARRSASPSETPRFS
jgi:hypothetical protein